MFSRTTKTAIPIIIVGILTMIIFMSIGLNQLEPGFSVVVLFLVIFVFFFGIAVGQRLTLPLKKMLDQAKELTKGNLSSRVYIDSKDELSELAGIFNKIAEDLQTSHDQESNIEKSVGIKVKARTEELQETINALEQKVKNRTVELERLMSESNKLQASEKNKEKEMAQLKKELSSFKQKVAKPTKLKSEVPSKNNT